VIATVAAGMLCGNSGARRGVMSPSTRIAAETFWEYVAFALNSIVFLLIGFNGARHKTWNDAGCAESRQYFAGWFAPFKPRRPIAS
jgi:hypothetical protein